MYIYVYNISPRTRYPNLRGLVLCSVFVVVVQIWQAALQQFPNWEVAFRSLSRLWRLVYQLSVLLLSACTLSVPVFLSFGCASLDPRRAEEALCAVLLGELGLGLGLELESGLGLGLGGLGLGGEGG